MAPEHDCPACPACKSEVGTPIRDHAGDLTTDRWCGPGDATCWCPACGCGWVASPAELTQARRALAAYYRAEGYGPPEPPAEVRAPEPVDPRQLSLFGGDRG